jgi:hypothetical protein
MNLVEIFKDLLSGNSIIEKENKVPVIKSVKN